MSLRRARPTAPLAVMGKSSCLTLGRPEGRPVLIGHHAAQEIELTRALQPLSTVNGHALAVDIPTLVSHEECGEVGELVMLTSPPERVLGLERGREFRFRDQALPCPFGWEWAGRYGVDPYLIFCVMEQESQFHTRIVSPKGARGLMQLMPATGAHYGVRNAFDPAQNIMGGTRYLKKLLEQFGGRVDLVLAGYNAGEGAVMKYGRNVPPYRETRNYVKKISARYKQSRPVVVAAENPVGFASRY